MNTAGLKIKESVLWLFYILVMGFVLAMMML